MRRILAITTSPLPIGGQITDGPGFRMWGVFHELSRHYDVDILSLYESFHLASPNPQPRRTPEGFQIESPSHRPRVVQQRIRELSPDVLYLPWQCVDFLGAANRRIPTIIDYVGPGLLEEFVSRGRIPAQMLRLFEDSFGCGDFFITTTSRERYYLIGLLAASGKLASPQFDTRDALVSVVRMTPPSSNSGARQVLPRTDHQPLSVLLAGAFLPWYDYSVLADAVAVLPESEASGVRVRILGGNPRQPEMVDRVRRALLTGKNAGTFEFVGLVPFEQRLDYYASADVALALGPGSVEDDLSARTRVVDYLAAHLPILSPGRDEYSSQIIEQGAGFVYDSPRSLADWFVRLRHDPALLGQAQTRIPPLLDGPFNGTLATRPILEFIEHPKVRLRLRSRQAELRRAGWWLRDTLVALRHGRP